MGSNLADYNIITILSIIQFGRVGISADIGILNGILVLDKKVDTILKTL